MMQWIPGAESPENLQFAAKARDEFNKVLAKDSERDDGSGVARFAGL